MSASYAADLAACAAEGEVKGFVVGVLLMALAFVAGAVLMRRRAA